MAKRKQVEVALKNWDEVDEKLGFLCKLESRRRTLDGRMNAELTRVRQKYEGELNALGEETKVLETQVEQFCIAHRVDMGAKKSIALTHGTPNFRTHPPSVKLLNRKWKWESVTEALGRAFERLVRTKREPDKDAILAAYAGGEVDDDDLAGVGVQVDRRESFAIDLKVEEAVSAALKVG